MDKRRILVVDDEVKILEVVKSYLENAGYTVIALASGLSALEALKTENISLILLDLMLPDITGEDICKKVRETSQLPIIMMTAKVDEESVINGLQIGADDYITKPFSPRQLVARVAAVLRRYGENGPAKNRMEYKNLTVNMETHMVFKNGQAMVLTPNEFNILALLMARPYKVFTRDEIIMGIKTDQFDGYDRSIDSHIKNLRQKIEADPRCPEYITTVYGIGYRFGKNEG